MSGFNNPGAAAGGGGVSWGPGYVAGLWYGTSFMAPNGSSGNFQNVACFTPFMLSANMTVSDLGARISNADAAGNIQLAIYAADATTKKPTGSPLAVTANISTVSAVSVSADITGANVPLTAGTLYYAAINTSSATARVPFGNSTNNAPTPPMQFIGTTTLNSVLTTNQLWGYTTALTFGTWGDLTAATFAETNGGVQMALKAA